MSKREKLILTWVVVTFFVGNSHGHKLDPPREFEKGPLLKTPIVRGLVVVAFHFLFLRWDFAWLTVGTKMSFSVRSWQKKLTNILNIRTFLTYKHS